MTPEARLQIPAGYNQDRVQIWPHSLKGPYINRLIALTDSKLVFDGYFRIEPEMLPVDRILWLIERKREYHICITDCKRGENTSHYWYDEDVGENICLTPTEIIELTFEVVAKDLPGPAFNALAEAIEAREESKEFEDRNWEARKAREDAKFKAAMASYKFIGL